LRLKSEFLAL